MSASEPMLRDATLSACGAYRYLLTRRWGSGAGVVVWVLLNPSTADGQVDDPTLRRCIGFSRDWGYDALALVNLYGLRATNPTELLLAADPVGPENDATVLARLTAPETALVVLGWGAHPAISPERSAAVLRLCRRHGVVPACLGLTQRGQPRHPLYLAASTAREAYPL